MGKTTYVIYPGDRFGRGRVVREIRVPRSRGGTQRAVVLLCDCGTTYQVRLQDLTKAKKPTRSCGCLARETATVTMQRPENIARLTAYAQSPEGRANSSSVGKARTIHGLSRHDGTQHPLYQTWSGIMTRCYNEGWKQYQDWGGRGITVCERWHDPRSFIEDIESLLGPRPAGMTLDRINNDGNYEPGNMRWADRGSQVRNSRVYKGGRRSHPFYEVWWRMRKDYPGQVCDRWEDWDTFITDMAVLGDRPEGRWFFVRINRAAPYELGNVRWSRSPR